MIRKTTFRTTGGTPNKRQGSAIIELALSLPMTFLIVFGSIEASNAQYMQQVVTEVAYLGALEGIKFDATEQSVIANMQTYIGQTTVGNASFQVVGTDGTPFNDVERGESFTVIVTVPANNISMTMYILSGLEDIAGTRVAKRQ